MLKSLIPYAKSALRAPWAQAGLLGLSVSLIVWLVAVLDWGMPVGLWALLAGIGSGWLFWRGNPQPQFVSASDAASSGTFDVGRQVLADFDELDAQISISLGKISTMSAESVAGMVSRVDDLRKQSARLIQYLEQSGLQSDQMQVVIHKNTEIIDYIYQFIRQLEQRVSEERRHSQRLLTEVEQFAEMTHVIRSIARQTEILAINSTIEAVRAGEAGRGFAVLAGEVRRLSLQSNQSAARIEQDISRLIQTVQESVGKGHEKRMEEERAESQNLLALTQQLSDGYIDMRDFYQILMKSITENNIKLNDNIQLLLDWGQHQDVYKQILERAQAGLLKRGECLADWLSSLGQADMANRVQVAERVRALVREYVDSEANHGGSGDLVDKETGDSLERIELF